MVHVRFAIKSELGRLLILKEPGAGFRTARLGIEMEQRNAARERRRPLGTAAPLRGSRSPSPCRPGDGERTKCERSCNNGDSPLRGVQGG